MQFHQFHRIQMKNGTMWYRIPIPLEKPFYNRKIQYILIEQKEINGPPAISVPLYIRIAERLITQIESGELPPGNRLAPERNLSQELNINRMTLRRSLQVLESQGFLIRKHGIGNFISHPLIDDQHPFGVSHNFT